MLKWRECLQNKIKSADFSSGDIHVKDSTVKKAEFSGSSTIYFDGCTIGELISWDMSTVITDSDVTTLDASHMNKNTITVDGVVAE
ncbi:MAG: hypothetical protein IKV53_05340 [Clostridia bacterium]|nr:hypothetical protein [Clostridia bacterium]